MCQRGLVNARKREEYQEKTDCPAHLGINDVCDVTGGQQRHPDELQHVRQVGLALFSVVFDPIQHGLKDGLLGVHLREREEPF